MKFFSDLNITLFKITHWQKNYLWVYDLGKHGHIPLVFDSQVDIIQTQRMRERWRWLFGDLEFSGNHTLVRHIPSARLPWVTQLMPSITLQKYTLHLDRWRLHAGRVRCGTMRRLKVVQKDGMTRSKSTLRRSGIPVCVNETESICKFDREKKNR